MTKDEYKAHQSRLGLKNAEAALVFRVSPRTIERWRSGGRAVPGPLTALVEVLTPEQVRWLLAQGCWLDVMPR